jgi:hypothetical protein
MKMARSRATLNFNLQFRVFAGTGKPDQVTARTLRFRAAGKAGCAAREASVKLNAWSTNRCNNRQSSVARVTIEI